MNDLQKNQNIYKAMCEVADELFRKAVEQDDALRRFMANKVSISNAELNKCWEWGNSKIGCDRNNSYTVTVDTFTCSFSPSALFGSLLESFRNLAKEKASHVFTYEEKIENEFIGFADVTLDNADAAKTLADYVSTEDYYPPLCNVFVEMNATTGDINFVACDRYTLGVITTNRSSIASTPQDGSKVFQALFTAADWKQICDYAKRSKSSVKFDIYKFAEGEIQDTVVSHIGDKKIKSVQIHQSYPNWRSVLAKDTDKHFSIHPDDRSLAQKFIKSIKLSGKNEKKNANVFVSFYSGSNIFYFDYINLETGMNKTASFRLNEASQETIGVCYNVSQLQKMKFYGFHIEDSQRATIIDCEQVDYMLVMPIRGMDAYVFNVNEREMKEVTV